jgi:hypothetical protein
LKLLLQVLPKSCVKTRGGLDFHPYLIGFLKHLAPLTVS